jgi:hypothetical protein
MPLPFFPILGGGRQKATVKTMIKKKGRVVADTAFRIVVAGGARLGADPAGSENPVPGTPYGMTMRHWITSFS